MAHTSEFCATLDAPQQLQSEAPIACCELAWNEHIPTGPNLQPKTQTQTKITIQGIRVTCWCCAYMHVSYIS